ncbi:hypothetical protein U9M48_016236 [Paspalum notatum var. saurae]|uniref:Reverse transcriptase domain-containing protein n=1 Tax=Paspalum notatum var. saurae TaxID=547442 RepID=A0AAQ3T519_PASNO
MLTDTFTEKEVTQAIFQMEQNKAPGLDGFSAEFYQFFWETIKVDLMMLFVEFHKGCLPLYSLNFGIITLLPKEKDAKHIKHFCPICLLNVSFKIFTKVTCNRLDRVANNIIRPTQTAFMSGRYIMEGVVILHETLHEMHRKKLDGVILKLDFEKAYDKVKWSFLQQTLRMKGFSSKWCNWIHQMVTNGCVEVKVNDNVREFFHTKKGLRQGDPMSPILFNLIADMLAILIARAKVNGQFGGLVPHLVDEGLSILQYADDTIIFMGHDVEKAKNMKLILCAFEHLSGLKINYHKSELFCYGEASKFQEQYSQLFGCGMGSYPFRYLDIPMHHRRINNKDRREVENRFEKKLSSWKGKHLSYGGRLVLINSCLTILALFMLSFFEIPREGDGSKKKYRLAKWKILCTPKEQGGLGIQDLDVQNKCLLSKWLSRLINEDGVWQQLLRNKYLGTKPLSQVEKKPGDSQFWLGLMKVKPIFLNGGVYKVNSGSQVRFWEDNWLENIPLIEQYPVLCNIVHRKHDTVATVMSTSPLNISFQRALVGNKLQAWHDLVGKITNIILNDQPD